MMNFNNNAENMQKMMQFLAANPMFAAYLANFGGQNAQLSKENNKTEAKHNNGCNLDLQEHLKYADALVCAGIIDKDTGKSIKEKMSAAFSRTKKAPAAESVKGVDEVFKSDFLNTRECLLNYLKSLDTELSKEDLEKIESVVLELEKAAILKNTDENAQKTLNALQNANEIAKGRLECGSLTANGTKTAPMKTFSRDEISKMNTAEFLKNEPIINYQLQNGLL